MSVAHLKPRNRVFVHLYEAFLGRNILIGLILEEEWRDQLEEDLWVELQEPD